jgi:flagellar hook-length control protein FliK
MFSMPAWVNPAQPPPRTPAPESSEKSGSSKRPEAAFGDVLARQYEPQGRASETHADHDQSRTSPEASQEDQSQDSPETTEDVASKQPPAPTGLSDELAAELKLQADAVSTPEPKRSVSPASAPSSDTESEAAQTSSEAARGSKSASPLAPQTTSSIEGSAPGKAGSAPVHSAPDSGKADTTGARSFDNMLAQATRKTDAPPPAPQAPPPTPDQANADRVANAITTKLLPGGGKMEIRLDPPQLGRVHIDVQVVSGKLTATLTASNDEASRMLGHKLDHLRQSLESGGLTVDRLQVRTSSESSMRDASADQQQQSTGQDQRQGQSQDQRDLARRLWKKAMFGTDGLDVVG